MTEVPSGKISKEHVCSWCGSHSCMNHILVDVWGASACIRCAKARLIKVRKATEKTGTEAFLGADYKP
jgi:DNA-directed RNA polymerase subunit RPC12/RpoP